jgi:hypothetical protein
MCLSHTSTFFEQVFLIRISHTQVHANIMLEWLSYNMDSTKGINGCDCTCDVCDFIILGTCLAYHCQFSSQTNMWSSIVCLVTQQVQSTIQNAYKGLVLNGDHLITCPPCVKYLPCVSIWVSVSYSPPHHIQWISPNSVECCFIISSFLLLGVCTLQWPYMDITMVVFHVFLKYKKINKIRSIEITKRRFNYLKLS